MHNLGNGGMRRRTNDLARKMGTLRTQLRDAEDPAEIQRLNALNDAFIEYSLVNLNQIDNHMQHFAQKTENFISSDASEAAIQNAIEAYDEVLRFHREHTTLSKLDQSAIRDHRPLPRRSNRGQGFCKYS